MNDPRPADSGRRMLVNALEKEETRIALVADGRLEDYHVERSSRETLVGNVYKGRVENVHPSLQAAFVSIGLARNAFLHVSEVHGPGEDRWSARRGGGPRPKRLIQNLLETGQEIVVQVIRDEIGDKGPSVTMEIGIPGRFLVLTPLSRHVGISKRITNPAQRARLRDIVERLAGADPEAGFIVRTSSAETEPQDLQADLEYLLRVWRSVEQRAQQARPPATLYQETDLVLRTVRDFFAPDIEEVVVDDSAVRDRLAEFFDAVMPRFRDRLRLHEGATPLFLRYGVEAQIEQLAQKQVPLPSGGSVVIEETEALTAIDVNSGRLVREASPEDLALRTNLEAAREIMRQLRLRDIGGIVVIDFIDMRQERHRRDVEDEVRAESRRDRSEMVILPMSRFCLVQIAREKIRPSVVAIGSDPCPACGGTGFIRNTESIGLEVIRALKGTLEREDIAVVEARVSHEVSHYLKSRRAEVETMEQRYRKRIHITPARDLPSNRVEFTCYNAAGEKVVEIVR